MLWVQNLKFEKFLLSIDGSDDEEMWAKEEGSGDYPPKRVIKRGKSMYSKWFFKNS